MLLREIQLCQANLQGPATCRYNAHTQTRMHTRKHRSGQKRYDSVNAHTQQHQTRAAKAQKSDDTTVKYIAVVVIQGLYSCIVG